MIRFLCCCLIALFSSAYGHQGVDIDRKTNHIPLEVQHFGRADIIGYLYPQIGRLQKGGDISSSVEIKKSRSVSYFLILIFVGIAFTIGLFSFIAFFFNRRIEFLYYTLYLIPVIVYLGKLPLLWEGVSLNLDSVFVSRIDSGLQIVASIFYYLFIRSFLNLGQELPMASRVVNISVAILVVLLLSEFVPYLVGKGGVVWVSLTQRLILISILFVTLGVMILTRLRTLLVYMLLSGTSILIFGSLMFSLYNNFSYLVIGLIFEVLIFALAILYKVKLINDERDRVRVEALENKNRALRAQINPHFIFNALGSIQNLVAKDEKTAALEYLKKFGRLTRNILDRSMDTHVLLSEEIIMTKDYLELESLRFNDYFKYIIEVDKNIDPKGVEVPMLVVQPFVENAIIHGLLLKTEGERLLKVQFKKEDGFILCTIEDNGVGREESSKIKTKPYKKKSHGIEVTSQRFGDKNSVTIIDLIDDKGKPQGTRVELRIPLSID